MGKLRRIVSITAAAIFCLLCLTMSTGLSASSSDDTVDFVLLLDCTDSMVNSDTANICEAAAKMFTDLAPSNNARVAVVAFGNTWTPEYTFGSSEMSYMNDVMGRYARTRVCMTYDMVELGSSEERRSVKQAIHDRMNEDKFSHTNTYIGGGLMTALDVLFSSKSDDAALILMSDGRLSGFDTTDGVEWKSTNRELVDEARLANPAWSGQRHETGLAGTQREGDRCHLPLAPDETGGRSRRRFFSAWAFSARRRRPRDRSDFDLGGPAGGGSVFPVRRTGARGDAVVLHGLPL